MTTLIAWISFDQRRFSALNVASDSRITWGSSGKRWDAGRKIFASSVTPDIWAYCGDVVFPAIILSQIMSAADAGCLFDHDSTALERNGIVFDILQSSFSDKIPKTGFTILHASRDGEKKQAEPKLWRISFDPSRAEKWQNEIVKMDSVNAGSFAWVVEIKGSGDTATKHEIKRWETSDIGGTSRSIYSAFCESIRSSGDPLSGGAPQIASIYPEGPAKIVGTVFNDSLHLFGLPIKPISKAKEINWFDSLFQRIDPTTMKNLEGAARHAKPKISRHPP